MPRRTEIKPWESLPVTWEEMDRVRELAQRLRDDLNKLHGIAGGGSRAMSGEYAAHISRSVKGYVKHVRALGSELIEAIERVKDSKPQGDVPDGALTAPKKQRRG